MSRSKFERPRVNTSVAMAASGHAIETLQARSWGNALADRGILCTWTQPLSTPMGMEGDGFAKHFADGGPVHPGSTASAHKESLAAFATARLRVISAASTLLVINYGEANLHAKNNVAVNPVANYITGEVANTLHIAMGMGKRIILSDDYPENHPNPTMQPQVLETLGVVALDSRMSIGGRADVVVEMLEETPLPADSEILK